MAAFRSTTLVPERGPRQAKFVALCGPDGAGKTTLLKGLQQRASARVRFVPRGPAICERLVERYLPRSGVDTDWLEQPFGNAIAVACALDYLAYYESTILPALQADQIVIADRHALCFEAYARCLSSPGVTAITLLSAVPCPDVVVYVTASAHAIALRLKARGGAVATNPFEAPQCQERFRLGYVQAFRDRAAHVVELDNSGPLGSSLETLQKVIETLAPDAFP